MNKLITSFLNWKNKHLKQKQFVYTLVVLVGITAGLSAVVIKRLVHLVEHLLHSSSVDMVDWLYFVYPVVGMLLSVAAIQFIIRGNVGHGIPSALYAISKNRGNIGKKNMYSSIITSAVTVGFGGSAGLEGPTVATSAAIGSNIGQSFKLDYKTKVLLIGCACTGALAAIFQAPVAAIVFAIEVIMLDLTAASMIPLLIASVTATMVSTWFLGEQTLFPFQLADKFDMSDLGWFILLGVFVGLIAVYFSKIYFFVDDSVKKINGPWKKVILGGIILGGLIFLFPALYGEGYALINSFIQGESDVLKNSFHLWEIPQDIHLLLLFLAVIIIIKPWATALTLQAGGVGGIFAPTLFLGSSCGYLFSNLVNDSEVAKISISNFSLVGMGAMMAGILQAPLTGIFLIAEITGGYELFLPLMIASTISYITVNYFTEYSVYTKQLADNGQLITHHKDKAVLTLMNLQDEIEKEFEHLHEEDSLEELVQAISRSKRNLFPVLDDNGALKGVINLNDVRKDMFNREKYSEHSVRDYMTFPPGQIKMGDQMEHVMLIFDKTGAWNLPVIDHENRYIGFVSKSRLFQAYRKQLKDFYEVLD